MPPAYTDPACIVAPARILGGRAWAPGGTIACGLLAIRVTRHRFLVDDSSMRRALLLLPLTCLSMACALATAGLGSGSSATGTGASGPVGSSSEQGSTASGTGG